VQVTITRDDGDQCVPGDVVAQVAGSASTLLVGERTALNFLQRLSGIATRARSFVEAAGGRIVILDTRKTTPTLRQIEKYAVRAGGATNHRAGLFDAVLSGQPRPPGRQVRRYRSRAIGSTASRSRSSADALRADDAWRPRPTSLLDNMSTETIREAVLRTRTAKIEISGGVTLGGSELARPGPTRVGRRADAFRPGDRYQLKSKRSRDGSCRLRYRHGYV
jgi:nicotinate-nucleotide pyrophosphorylase (carboxylating)